MHLNVEIKASCPHVDFVKNYLESNNALYKGLDAQTDTYFNVSSGRLKHRRGNIENSLIHYERSNQSGPKDSKVTLTRLEPDNNVDEVLESALGIKVRVVKYRHIYFIDNVKFHIDELPELGNFVEIEAIDTDGTYTQARLLEQCEYYMKVLNISDNLLITNSYSDILLNR
ncbi:class IV adenylate cyclase [Polluticaenibacter yanchengensis]|uniref:Class IV adenylate cyclase n=1 Tax=Polluticaenibacter yanchengensis TaxID=3014562 RepID=A0ABT4UPX5_9BACT|nr:class IV adenylate cyclase [Chitinophagaceae bacterium LY-5]